MIFLPPLVVSLRLSSAESLTLAKSSGRANFSVFLSRRSVFQRRIPASVATAKQSLSCLRAQGDRGELLADCRDSSCSLSFAAIHPGCDTSGRAAAEAKAYLLVSGLDTYGSGGSRVRELPNPTPETSQVFTLPGALFLLKGLPNQGGVSL